MIHPEIRGEIPYGQIRPAIPLADQDQHGRDDGQPEIAEQDQLRILGFVQRARWVEVVDAVEEAVRLALAATLALALVVVVAGDVAQQIARPTAQLLLEEIHEGHDGRVLRQLGQLVRESADVGGVLLAPSGHEDHVPLQVAGGLVMLAVGDLPGEVGDQEGGMTDPTDGVVELLRRREGLVAAFVGEHPETGAEETLDEGIEGPEPGPQQTGGDRFGRHITREEPEGHGQRGHVPGHVRESSPGGSLKAMGGNGIPDLLNGEIGELKGIAKSVDQLHRLRLSGAVRGVKRRQGRRGGGVTWALCGRGRQRAGRGIDHLH